MLQIQAIVLKQMKMFSKRYSLKQIENTLFWNILTGLVDCPVFRMFRNFQFITKHSDLFYEHFKNVLGNFQDCSEMFRFVFETLQKCSKILRHFRKCSETFWLV